MRIIAFALAALIALGVPIGSASAQQACRHSDFEKSWVNNLTGPCTFKLDELKGQGMSLRGNIKSGGTFHAGTINFKCAGLSVPGVICGVTSVVFDDRTAIDSSHEVLNYGLHVMGSGDLKIENPYDPKKWVNMTIRAREGKVMPPR